MLIPAGLFAQDEPKEAAPPAPKGLSVRLVAGRDRLLYPGGLPAKLRVGLRLTFEEGAPPFHADMLSVKALAWVDAGGKVQPIDPQAGELPAGTLALPSGTIVRTILALDPPSFPDAQQGFKLRWSYPGGPTQELAFTAPKEIAAKDLPEFMKLDLGAINRSLVRLHFARLGAGEQSESIGSILFRLRGDEKGLTLMRSFLDQAVAQKAFAGMPIFHLAPKLFFQVGPPLGGEEHPAMAGISARMITPAPDVTLYERGDLVLLATLYSQGATVGRNMWYGQMMVPFAPLNAPAGDKAPASTRIGEAVGSLDLLDRLAAEPTVRDPDLPYAHPLHMLVIDGIDFLSFD